MAGHSWRLLRSVRGKRGRICASSRYPRRFARGRGLHAWRKRFLFAW